MPTSLVSGVRWLRVDDGMVVFVPEPPQFVDLNWSATELWDVLERSAWSADAAIEHLAAHYDLGSDEARRVVETLLADLEVRSVITRPL